MHPDDEFELMSEIEETVPREQKAERFEEVARTMTVGEPGRAGFLVSAGEHRQMRGEYAEARRLYREALEDGGHTDPHPLTGLHSLALAEAREDLVEEAVSRLKALSRAGELGADSYHYVGESFESHGRLKEAMRWFTIPLSLTEEEDDFDYLCLIGRLRVRRALELPPDHLDVLAQAEMDARRAGP